MRPTVLPKDSADLTTPRFSVRSLGDKGYLFVSNYIRQYPMAVQKDTQFSIRLPGGTVAMPSHPVDIPSGAYFVWPINMDLAGARLVYATAQPITHVEEAGVPVYVFAAQSGIAPEFAISADRVSAVTAPSGHVEKDAAGRYVVSGIRAGTDATFDIHEADGRVVRILILTPEQTDRLSIADFDGATRLVLTSAQFFTDSDNPVFLSTGEPDIRFSVFPAPAKSLAGSLPIRMAGRDGVFETYEASAPKKAITVTATKTRDARPVPPLVMTGPGKTAVEPMPETFGKSAAWTIHIAPDALNGVEDAFLRINARGDVGRLFSGATMIDDQFFNGSTWEIGLKRFANEIRGPLTLTILPMRSDAAVYLDRGVASMVSGDQTAEVVEVSAVPQYALRLRTATHKRSGR